MDTRTLYRSRRAIIFLATIVTTLFFSYPGIAAPGDRQITSGPYSLTIRPGAENNSEALGFDGRIDYLNPLVNVHLFGTYDWLNAGRGEGEIDNKRYGAGAAVSHTYARKANAFLGTAFIRELGDTFGHAYVGGKLKVADYALLSASYGFGFGHAKEISKITSRLLAAESVDWLKAGVVLVNRNGWKANAYYTLTDPGDLRLSGVEGEVSYPVLDSVFAGVNGSCDLTRKTDLERNWRAFAFLTYAFGEQKGSPIDVALDKNNPAEYPRIVKKLVKTAAASTSTLSISPSPASISAATACNPGNTVTFTASGGTPPYTFSIAPPTLGGLTPNPPSQTVWNACDTGLGNGTVTVTDSLGQTATANVSIVP